MLRKVQGVCQFREVREVREKSGNSLYPLKSQGKVREFSDKSGKSQGISVKLGDLFWEQQMELKRIKILINFKNFWFWEDKFQEKKFQKVDRESGKTSKKSGKNQGKVREFCAKYLADTLKSLFHSSERGLIPPLFLTPLLGILLLKNCLHSPLFNRKFPHDLSSYT